MRFFFSLILFTLLLSCNRQAKGPDVSKIKVQLNLQRFEEDLFAIDTTNAAQGMQELFRKYPSFAPRFFSTILNVDPAWKGDTLLQYIRGFISSYRPVYDSSEAMYKDFSKPVAGIEQGLKHVKYYFPNYPLPASLVTYIGPMDGFGDFLDEGLLATGLHQHLGSGFSMYQQTWMQETYPAYITQRFNSETIPVNAMRNIVNDLYPPKEDDRSLVVKMVEEGKRLYLLSALLPETKPHLLIGYTEKQYDESLDHEASIWNLFVQNNLLQTIDNNVIKNYIGDSPKTAELGDASPGNIGAFAGWQIVKKYMSSNSGTSPSELLKKDAELIFREAKYKP